MIKRRDVFVPGIGQIRLRQSGDAHAAALVLIHGANLSSLIWDEWHQAFQSRFNVISFDLPGHGESKTVAADFRSFASYLSFVKLFLDEIRVDRCHLLGHSFGGKLAWAFAANNQTIVERLVLLNASAFSFRAPQTFGYWLSQLSLTREFLRLHMPKRMFIDALRRGFCNPDDMPLDFAETHYDAIRDSENRLSAYYRFGFDDEDPSTDLLGSIACPTLVLHGECDVMIPSSVAHKIHSAVHDSHLRVLPSTGHYPMLEEGRQQVAATIERFLNS